MNTIVNIGLTAVVAFTQVTSPQLIETTATETNETAYASTIKLSATMEPFEIQEAQLQQVVAAPKKQSTELNEQELKQLAEKLVTEHFGAGHFKAFDAIVTHESTWNPKAVNKRSGACGLPQALPCSKLPQGIKSTPEEQIEWMINYIEDRYTNPTIAWNTWQRQGWY